MSIAVIMVIQFDFDASAVSNVVRMHIGLLCPAEPAIRLPHGV
jgi:hypothetical protein